MYLKFLSMLEPLNRWAGLRPLCFAGWFLATFCFLMVCDAIRVRRRLDQLLFGGAVFAAIFAIALLTVSTMIYARVNHFEDHIEPQVVSVSWLYGHGKPLYPSFAAAERYGMLYGPVMYLTNYAALAVFGASIRVVKVLHMALLGASLVLIGAGVKSRSNWTVSLLSVGYAAMAIMILQHQEAANIGSWIRADPHLLFWTTVGVLCATALPPRVAIPGLACAIGLCTNLKIHGGIYLIPACLCLARRTSARAVGGALLLAVPVVLLPFVVMPSISLNIYIQMLGMSIRHGFSGELALKVAAYAFFLLLPVLAALAASFSGRDLLGNFFPYREYMTRILGLWFCAMLVVGPGSKEGGGLHHLLPLVPSFALTLGAILGLAWDRRGEASWLRSAAVAALFSFGVIGVSSSVVLHTLMGARFITRELLAINLEKEIQTICGTFAGSSIGMGFADGDKFEVAFLRPLLVFQGNPLLVDDAALMESNRSGIPIPPATRKALREGMVRVWLLPRGEEPFSTKSWYLSHPDPIFDRQFREDFIAYYRRQVQTQHYDIWIHI